MRKHNKALLCKALTKNSSTTHSEMAGSTNYVLDGGALLHRVSWKIPSTYADVVQQYCHYVERKYEQNITVVFDGYRSSTKDHEHQRRGKTKFSDVALQPQMEVNCKQAEFFYQTTAKLS